MATQINYKQIQAEADLYKYSIAPSISSWNLTVALKNYLWQNPSITTPVKVQIWDTVRTITSALSLSIGSWSNLLNLWSSELATKEVDLFTYLFWYTTRTWWPAVWLAVSRISYSNIWSDFTNSPTAEKGILWTSDWINFPASTDNFVNIGRFSAILSSGAWYTWSTPSAGFQVINSPIFNTKRLEINWVITWFSSVDNQTYYYWLEWHNVFIWWVNNIWWTSNSASFTMKLPFNSTWARDNFWFIAVKDNGINQPAPWHMVVAWNVSTVNIYKTFYGWSWTASWNKAFFSNSIMYPLIKLISNYVVINNVNIKAQWNYQI